MVNINPNLIPTKTAGTLFDALAGGDSTLNIRWINAVEPVFYEITNRPMADIAVRQLVLAKSIDNIAIRLSSQTLYPYLIQPKVASGTNQVDVPPGLIWDIHASLPQKWEKLRLAKIQRISGSNDNYSGILRFIFSAQVQSSSTEVYVFYADYEMDSVLTFQAQRLQVVTSSIDPTQPINPGETETVAGWITFKTLDADLASTTDFYDLLEPPVPGTDLDNDDIYDTPTVYEIVDSEGGGSGADDYSLLAVSHGTGLLTDSAYNAIPSLDSEVQTWLTTFNYPFATDANLTSQDGVVIPKGLFKEFNITAPAGDSPTGDTTGTYYPVYVSRIENITGTSQVVRFYFATYNVTDIATGGAPSTEPVEFGHLDLRPDGTPNEIIEINSISNLQLSADSNFNQHFGRGHVVLSDLWDGSTTAIEDFFNIVGALSDSPADTYFTIPSTRLSSYSISRVPKYSPTYGQAGALMGSTSRRATPVNPSYNNRYVCESDRGLGDSIDLDNQPGITPNLGVERYGYTGGCTHKTVKLVVDASKSGDSPTYYTDVILPRLTILFGRPPEFGDEWFNGTRFMRFNGDTWIG